MPCPQVQWQVLGIWDVLGSKLSWAVNSEAASWMADEENGGGDAGAAGDGKTAPGRPVPRIIMDSVVCPEPVVQVC